MLAQIDPQALAALRVAATFFFIVNLLGGAYIFRNRHRFFDRDPNVDNDIPAVRRIRVEVIMVIGAGQMAERCVQSLVSKGVPSIFVSSRSFDRAINLTTRCGGEAICFGDCLFEMRDIDVVVAATSSGQTLLGLDDIENLMKSRCNRPLLLIDLSVPRNIDSAAGRLENVTLYNIDDLEALTREGAQARERELAACHQIIEAQLAPLIEKLHSEDERFEGAGRSRTSCYSFEIAEKVPYELATPPGLVGQTS